MLFLHEHDIGEFSVFLKASFVCETFSFLDF